MAEYIEREAAFNAILKLVPKVDGDGYCWVIRGDAATAIDAIPAADVRPVVLCGVCELHGHCYAEDVFAFARLAEENRFCAVGKVKTKGKKKEES